MLPRRRGRVRGEESRGVRRVRGLHVRVRERRSVRRSGSRDPHEALRGRCQGLHLGGAVEAPGIERVSAHVQRSALLLRERPRLQLRQRKGMRRLRAVREPNTLRIHRREQRQSSESGERRFGRSFGPSRRQHLLGRGHPDRGRDQHLLAVVLPASLLLRREGRGQLLRRQSRPVRDVRRLRRGGRPVHERPTYRRRGGERCHQG
mmetsp:Transcript_913/g.2616  ORF Transcript_913/g.2616 Transcript_913/m.2616 type:complete len:205 (+) Transcript_913:1104-1718(+)